MAEEQAKAQGIFVPNWYFAVLLIPLCGAVIWLVSTLTEIRSNQANLQNTIEFRLRIIERDVKLNDEHLRQVENRVARIEGKKNIPQPVEPEQ
jgi:hypothetical protein